MNYTEKIRKNCQLFTGRFPEIVSDTIPHQSYSPREILAQFACNDVKVMSLNPTDDIELDEYDDIDHVVTFEDEFEARDYVRNHYYQELAARKSALEKEAQKVVVDQKEEQPPVQPTEMKGGEDETKD